jgi:hypothetical protein
MITLWEGLLVSLWSVIMWQQIFAKSEPGWRTQPNVGDAQKAGLTELEHGPRPSELFFETGMVLAAALGTALAVQLVFGS